MKVIIGAGNTSFNGWISTNKEDLDLLEKESFKKFFHEKKADALFAEHVWEHLTFAEGKIAARNCYDFLEDGGYLRVAVPDRNFRNADYQKLVQVGGPGPKEHLAFSHKILYDVSVFTKLFKECGFEVNLLEYCDDMGTFHYNYWNPDDGRVGRSFRFDTRNSKSKLGMVSLILDAHKPIIIS
ncbi:conserved hypothetical protein [Carnobacterium maltaromaticum]|uniref:class I SAM-dependent methyltransferase n=1 Tax=Carnobacterium maltaromaticum TaxID=2751 RepID=UPI00191BC087|nr:hypothetical protein [Carnobacterium maltaromaticum]CAD5898483.1 conserved hypothetical protein [Carnobacterium maltaromaticum]